MKPIPNQNLCDTYRTEISKSKGWDPYYQRDIKELTKLLEKEKNPFDFRNMLLAITQLYFDGIISSGKGEWSRQETILNQLILAGKNAIGTFYRGEGIDTEGINGTLLGYTPDIVKHSSTNGAKSRNLLSSYDIVQTFGLNLQKKLNNNIFLDSLVCIASGAFEPSFLIMDIMENDILIPVRYSHISGRRNDEEPKIPKKSLEESYITSKVKDKKVLVIEDIIASGRSLSKIMKYIAKMKPHELYGTTVNGGSPILPDLKTEIIEGSPFIWKYSE